MQNLTSDLTCYKCTIAGLFINITFLSLWYKITMPICATKGTACHLLTMCRVHESLDFFGGTRQLFQLGCCYWHWVPAAQEKIVNSCPFLKIRQVTELKDLVNISVYMHDIPLKFLQAMTFYYSLTLDFEKARIPSNARLSSKVYAFNHTKTRSSFKD